MIVINVFPANPLQFNGELKEFVKMASKNYKGEVLRIESRIDTTEVYLCIKDDRKELEICRIFNEYKFRGRTLFASILMEDGHGRPSNVHYVETENSLRQNYICSYPETADQSYRPNQRGKRRRSRSPVNVNRHLDDSLLAMQEEIYQQSRQRTRFQNPYTANGNSADYLIPEQQDMYSHIRHSRKRPRRHNPNDTSWYLGDSLIPQKGNRYRRGTLSPDRLKYKSRYLKSSAYKRRGPSVENVYAPSDASESSNHSKWGTYPGKSGRSICLQRDGNLLTDTDYKGPYFEDQREIIIISDSEDSNMMPDSNDQPIERRPQQCERNKTLQHYSHGNSALRVPIPNENNLNMDNAKAPWIKNTQDKLIKPDISLEQNSNLRQKPRDSDPCYNKCQTLSCHSQAPFYQQKHSTNKSLNSLFQQRIENQSTEIENNYKENINEYRHILPCIEPQNNIDSIVTRSANLTSKSHCPEKLRSNSQTESQIVINLNCNLNYDENKPFNECDGSVSNQNNKIGEQSKTSKRRKKKSKKPACLKDPANVCSKDVVSCNKLIKNSAPPTSISASDTKSLKNYTLKKIVDKGISSDSCNKEIKMVCNKGNSSVSFNNNYNQIIIPATNSEEQTKNSTKGILKNTVNKNGQTNKALDCNERNKIASSDQQIKIPGTILTENLKTDMSKKSDSYNGQTNICMNCNKGNKNDQQMKMLESNICGGQTEKIERDQTSKKSTNKKEEENILLNSNNGNNRKDLKSRNKKKNRAKRKLKLCVVCTVDTISDVLQGTYPDLVPTRDEIFSCPVIIGRISKIAHSIDFLPYYAVSDVYVIQYPIKKDIDFFIKLHKSSRDPNIDPYSQFSQDELKTMAEYCKVIEGFKFEQDPISKRWKVLNNGTSEKNPDRNYVALTDNYAIQSDSKGIPQVINKPHAECSDDKLKELREEIKLLLNKAQSISNLKSYHCSIVRYMKLLEESKNKVDFFKEPHEVLADVGGDQNVAGKVIPDVNRETDANILKDEDDSLVKTLPSHDLKNQISIKIEDMAEPGTNEVADVEKNSGAVNDTETKDGAACKVIKSEN